MANDYQERIQSALIHRVKLSEKYRVEICSYDRTALAVHCTDRELALICKQFQCSGIYSEEAGVGTVTNFGQYR